MTAPDCPSPATRTVPDPNAAALRHLRTMTLPAGTPFATAYRRSRWPAQFNASGLGTARFSPLRVDGDIVPTMYAARRDTVALLESVFHEVHGAGPRIVSEPLDLATRGLVRLRTPAPVALFDLRDDALTAMGLTRRQLPSALAAHYPCTRRWAEVLHGRGVGRVRPIGIIWGSRIAELTRGDHPMLADLLTAPADEAFVIFGDAISTTHATWRPTERRDDLTTGAGRVFIESVATTLGATIVPV